MLNSGSRSHKLVVGTLATILVFLALVNFQRQATFTAERTIFLDPPSELYFISGFPTFIPDTTDTTTQVTLTSIDSIKVGDLLLAVDGQVLSQVEEFENAITAAAHDTTRLRLEVFRLPDAQARTFSVQKQAIPDSVLTELSGVVYAHNLPEGVPARLAGLQRGDLVYRVNGERFGSLAEFETVLERSRGTENITYNIIRNNQRSTLTVNLPTFDLELSVVFALLSGLVFFGVGIFIGLTQPEVLGARLLGSAFICFGYIVAVGLAHADHISDLLNQLVNLCFSGALAFGLALWIDSKFYFPTERPEIIDKVWPRRLLYLTAGVFFLSFSLFGFDLFSAGRFGQGLVVAMLVVFAGLAVVLPRLFKGKDSKEFVKIRRLLGVISAVMVAIAVLIDYLLISSGELHQIGYVGIPLVFIPLSYLYVAGRYQLLGMSLGLSRKIQYVISTSVWATILVLLLTRILLFLPKLDIPVPHLRFLGTSLVLIDYPLDPELRDFGEKVVAIIVALGLTVAFWRIGKSGQATIQRKFNRQKYNLSRATGELAEIMAIKVGMVQLAQGIIEKLAKVMELKRVGVLFFRDEKECCCQEAFGFQGSEWDELCLLHGDRLREEVQRYRSESRFSIDFLPPSIKDEFLGNGFRHIIAIRFKDKLVGTFLIGEKTSESPFDVEDLTFLGAVAKQASIAIENAFLHEELTERERMKHELAIARRIQMASLPQQTPQIDGLDISGTSIPAMEVGGDYFDYLNGVAAALTVIVGDVSGKGTSAALYMSKVQGIIRSLHAFNLSPRELFIRANQLLCQDMEKKSFITAIGAFFDTEQRNLVLARAGHLPLFYYNAQSRAVELITPKGLGLGLDNADVFALEMEEKKIPYRTGDVFLFVTDGVTEAKTSGGGEFGEEKLSEVLAQSVSDTADGIRDRVIAAVTEFVADMLPHDDQTIVVVKTK